MKRKKKKRLKLFETVLNMYRELANLCEKRKKYSRNMP